MPKHERSEYMKGVFFAEKQKEIGWVFILQLYVWEK